jgi:hypothetical protein
MEINHDDKARYERYRLQAWLERWLRPAPVEAQCQRWEGKLSSAVIGRSYEDRPIYGLQWGTGPCRILLWAQVHGNEPTSAQALGDLMHWLLSKDEEDALRQELGERLTIYLIPQVNPDGAERHQRRNAQQIDINRDARAQQTPEMRVLQRYIEEVQPAWCFNLHDQRTRFSLGADQRPATLSFLAARSGPADSPGAVQGQARRLIGATVQGLPAAWQGQMGRFSDAFYPTALGDTLHQRGLPTLLLECGGAPGDSQRRTARQWCFSALLEALRCLSSGELTYAHEETYQALAQNEEGRRDLLIRDCYVENPDGTHTQLQLGFEQREMAHLPSGQLHRRWYLTDLGDLDDLQGYLEVPGGRIPTPAELVLDKPAHFCIMGAKEEIIFKNGLWNP